MKPVMKRFIIGRIGVLVVNVTTIMTSPFGIFPVFILILIFPLFPSGTTGTLFATAASLSVSALYISNGLLPLLVNLNSALSTSPFY